MDSEEGDKSDCDYYVVRAQRPLEEDWQDFPFLAFRRMNIWKK